ncbi:MAG: hypothetical protein C5B52_07060, partial [Bacteroidetes bacterium]
MYRIIEFKLKYELINHITLVMKKNLLFAALIFFVSLKSQGQVTQLNNNGSLQFAGVINSSVTLLSSNIDKSIWVTDGTPGGTTQVTSTIEYEAGAGSLAAGKWLFVGTETATGTELYVTDGTLGGTSIVLDINTGPAGSRPSGFTQLNGFLYFEATTAAEGRELWRTDGTALGTTLVKDIVPGTDSSFNGNSSSFLFSSGTYLLFAANTAASGNELWISDGSGTGTTMLKEINTGNGNADSSNPKSFFLFNGKVLFTATDNTNGDEFWVTDGTPGNTILLKDINPGIGNSTNIVVAPFITAPVFGGFHIFNNKAYFIAFDGTSTGELWTTDGTPGNTSLVKDIISSPSLTFIPVVLAENLTNKFIFGASDAATRFELWESDGSALGTQLFKSFDPTDPSQIPVVLPSISASNGNLTYPLFKGTQFFFVAGTSAEGYELWITDGTPGGTQIVKDLNAGAASGIGTGSGISYIYTADSLFFAATDGTSGNEVYRTDGTSGGTTLEKDINPGPGDADPAFVFFSTNGKILFTATDGDDLVNTDLFALNGTFAALPIKLTDFTVTLLDNKESLLRWSTEQE